MTEHTHSTPPQSQVDERDAMELAIFENRTPPWENLDAGIVPLVRVLSRFPGIVTVSSCEGHPERSGAAEWHVGWCMRSSDPSISIIDAGPSAQGWLSTEWLMWMVQDMRRAGFAIRRDISTPPPYWNYPGRSMMFWIYGSTTSSEREPVTSARFLQILLETWQDKGYSYSISED